MSDLSQDLEQLVIAGRSASSPTDADFHRILGGLRGRVGGIATSSALNAAASAGHGIRWLSGKTIAFAAAGVALLIGGAAFWSHNRAIESSRVQPVALRQSVASAVPAMRMIVSTSSTRDVVAPAQPRDPLVANPSASQLKGPAPNASARESLRNRDSLSEEVAILARAETELHSGRVEGALRTLSEHERKFPNGILTEERIAARVQAFCALGRNAEANAQLARLKPGSLHSEAARRACAANSGVRQTTAAGQSPTGGSNKH